MDVTESHLPDRGHRSLAHGAGGRRLLGRVVRPVPAARARCSSGGRRARGQGRARQGRRRRQPGAGADVPDPGHPGGQGVPGRPGRGRVRRRPAAGGGRAVPRFAASLGGRRAGRSRATRSRCGGRSSSSRRAPTPPCRWPGSCTSRGETDEALERARARARQLRRRRPGRADRARASGRDAAQPAVPDLSEAFAALDAGDHERGARSAARGAAERRRRPRRHPPRGGRRPRRARRRASARARRAPPARLGALLTRQPGVGPAHDRADRDRHGAFVCARKAAIFCE